MPITPINKIKNVSTFIGRNKTNQGVWGDSTATWGDLLFSWGAGSASYVNKDKSSSGSITIEAGQPMGLLLAITYPTTFTSGNGWINKTKN